MVPSGQDGFTFPAWVVNHSAGIGSLPAWSHIITSGSERKVRSQQASLNGSNEDNYITMHNKKQVNDIKIMFMKNRIWRSPKVYLAICERQAAERPLQNQASRSYDLKEPCCRLMIIGPTRHYASLIAK